MVSLPYELIDKILIFTKNIHLCIQLKRFYPLVKLNYSIDESSKNGHLEVSKFLLEVNPNINISIDNEAAFRYTCQNGHLEVAKFLLLVKPDICNINENVFIEVCSFGHLEVAKWLLQIKPDITG